jgi:hypothetical protein
MPRYANHDTFLTACFRYWAPRLAHLGGRDGGNCYFFVVGDAHGELEVAAYCLVGERTPRTVVDSFLIISADARPIINGSAGSGKKR